jgi:hypothetical protein
MNTRHSHSQVQAQGTPPPHEHMPRRSVHRCASLLLIFIYVGLQSASHQLLMSHVLPQ